MKAIVIEQYGGPEVLRWRDSPMPEPGPGEILVKVAAAGVNQADITARSSLYPKRTPVPGIYFYPLDPLPAVPGVEAAGTVVAVGQGVTEWQIGDRVAGVTGSGSYAEYVKMLASVALPIPAQLSFAEGAAIPIAFLTAFIAINDLMQVRRGETLLIHGVGAGVGQAMVQYGTLIGARVIGTEIVPEKIDQAMALGLSAGCNSRERDFVEWALEQTGGAGVDAIVDTLGGPVFAASLRALAMRGRLVPLSQTLGATTTIELNQIIGKQLRISGMSTAAMLPAERIERFKREVLSGMPTLIRPVISRTFPISAAADAHRFLSGGTGFGKVILGV